MHHTELAARRRKLGLSQSQLSARLGVHPNVLARWERGELNIAHPKMLQLALKQLDREIEKEGQDETNEERLARNRQMRPEHVPE